MHAIYLRYVPDRKAKRERQLYGAERRTTEGVKENTRSETQWKLNQ